MSSDITTRLFSAYGISPTHVLEPQKGYRNTSYAANSGNGMVNVIVYKHEPGIRDRIVRANAFGDFLYSENLPARHTIDNRLLAVRSPQHTRYASLYTYLPGATIPWEGYTKHHIKLLGMCMGTIHAVSQKFDSATYPNVADEYLEIHKQMEHYFFQVGVQAALQKKLQLAPPKLNYKGLLEACKKLPNQRVLHMDLVRSNVLFDTNKNKELADGNVSLTGILDFEKAAFGHPIFDLARTYAFLLVDCKYKAEEKITKYFFRSGYAKRGRGLIPNITDNGQDVLTELTTMFLTYDFYKFLHHNPYESLSQNEHFVRTRDILITRGALERL